MLEKAPYRRIRVEEALTHPWITEKVKLRALRERWMLYPETSLEQKEEFEETLKLAKGE